jgi:NAD(P)-dependent dehydrogenase (short-subunit alcohol dehydrogenase family)
MGRVSGKVAVITGAAMGIGAASAMLLASEGAQVVLADINEAKGKEVLQQIKSNGGEGIFVRTDVTKSADVEALMKAAADQYGKIDILHNNAGVTLSASIVDTTDELFDYLLDINLKSVYRGCKYAIPYMLENGSGSIINTSSVQAMKGIEGMAAYAATKGAIISLTIQCAREYAKHSIRINCVVPGTIDSPMNDKFLDELENPEELIQFWKGMNPMGRIGKPQDVAEAVLYLGSDAASFIVGQCIVMDGGLTIKA